MSPEEKNVAWLLYLQLFCFRWQFQSKHTSYLQPPNCESVTMVILATLLSFITSAPDVVCSVEGLSPFQRSKNESFLSALCTGVVLRCVSRGGSVQTP